MRGTETALYIYVHNHGRLIDVALDSPLAWLLTALLVDLGYYWVHRAGHGKG